MKRPADSTHRTTDQVADAQRAVLCGHRRLSGQLQIAIGHYLLAVWRLHAHLAGDAGIERGTDGTIMGFTRQFFLGRQRDCRRRPGLAMPLDVMASDRQMRVGLAVDGGFQPRQ
ncbi:hypothetical protein PAERUG_E15_London_28_01_14_03843 [Pseudomonas aeruginosa]|nr:hypothetical protein PAERUG_E15_London_28_01_14_03843 [Pseudomonas aeruginosa]